MIPAISRPSTLLGRIKVEKVDKFGSSVLVMLNYFF
jgi:hypothetical protein